MNCKALVIECGKRMLHSNLTVETYGNISIRDKETDNIFMTPSGMPYDTLTEDDIVVFNKEGVQIEGKRKPTIEYELHLSVMKARPDVNVILHTHPVYSTVFATLHEDIPPIIDEAAQILCGTVKTAEYALPGTPELAANVTKALGSVQAVLLANHGALCVGEDVGKAFRVCTVLEMTSHIYFMARSIGKPVVIGDKEVEYMVDFMKNKYGQR